MRGSRNRARQSDRARPGSTPVPSDGPYGRHRGCRTRWRSSEHSRHLEQPGLGSGIGRAGEDHVAIEAGALHVVAVCRMAGHHACRRQDAGRVDPLDLFRVSEDVAELAREQIDLVFGELEMGQRRDGADLVARETGGHAEMLTCRKMTPIRRAAVAGTWYPGTANALAAAVDRHLSGATRDIAGDLVALVSPHAGLMYSGPVAAHAYHLLRGRSFDVAVLVGPSHYVGFEGVAVVPSGGFETPYGIARIDEGCTAQLRAAGTVVVERPDAH